MDKDESLKQEPIRGWFTADEFVEMADRRTKEWAKQADIADIIAGELKVSRGTAYDMMREALKEAAPVQEPVAWIWTYANGEQEVVFVPPRHVDASHVDAPSTITSLYTTPPAAQRHWVGLTDDEVEYCWDGYLSDYQLQHIREIEAKLKERNT